MREAIDLVLSTTCLSRARCPSQSRCSVNYSYRYKGHSLVNAPTCQGESGRCFFFPINTVLKKLFYICSPAPCTYAHSGKIIIQIISSREGWEIPKRSKPKTIMLLNILPLNISSSERLKPSSTKDNSVVS